MNLKSGALAIFLALAPLNEALSWGSAGHSIIAEIAQRRLHPHVLRQIRNLLDGNASLASIAGGADHLVLLRPNTANWHFVNIPYDATSYDATRDCRETPAGDCVINAIQRARATLADRSAPKPRRAEALMFLVHLVGDAHQPLHTVDRDDAGGNRTMVTFFDRPISLHMLWDVAIIEKQTFDWGEYVQRLETTWFPGKDVRSLARGEPADWAWDAHTAAVNVGYALPEDMKLGDDYTRAARTAVDRQLALAGIRLARLLNEAFGHPNFVKSAPTAP
jgi:hypothetical protein